MRDLPNNNCYSGAVDPTTAPSTTAPSTACVPGNLSASGRPSCSMCCRDELSDE